MATGKYRTHATAIQNHFLLGSSQTAPSAADVRIALVESTNPSSTSIATELTETGYTAGGIACGFGTPVAGDPTVTDNDAQIQWTNSGGGAWATITGAIVHRGGGTLALATAMYFLDSLSIDVPASATLTIAAGALDVSES